MLPEMWSGGPDPQRYTRTIQQYADMGYDHVHLHQIGENQEGFIRFIAEEDSRSFRDLLRSRYGAAV
jgi:hypothetical protein